jgi:uncharacterized membrane protein
METIYPIIKILHIAAGVGTLIMGPLAIYFNFKQRKSHRLVGKIFMYCMAWVCASALVGICLHPENLFFQFLAGIAVFTSLNILRAVRSMQIMLKKVTPGAFENGIVWAYLLGGVGMLATASYYFTEGKGSTVINILFVVFGAALVANGLEFRKTLARVGPEMNPKWWYREHITGMLGAFIASNTAFLVNTTGDWLHPLLQFLLPTVILMPVAFYFTKLLGIRKRDIV